MKSVADWCVSPEFLSDNMMGPNSMAIVQELLQGQKLTPGMRVLDLGCGRGLTSVYLAKTYGVQVFAADLWISATENYQHFRSLGLENQIIPIHADAGELPFAQDYFDAIVSVDSYHYFGNNDTFAKEHLLPLLKKDGLAALAFPGMKFEVLGVFLWKWRRFGKKKRCKCGIPWIGGGQNWSRACPGSESGK